MTAPTTLRRWTAACPNCGAPVSFASPASASAVCSFCQSTLLREGNDLRRIGLAGDLFDDHSPLQIGASGQYQGARFTLVGRVQWSYGDGCWNEWHALFDAAPGSPPKGAWLSEDNGQYVFAFDSAAPDLPLTPGAMAATALGTQWPLAGQRWTLASVTQAQVRAAQGELPQPPAKGEHTIWELRNPQDEVASLQVPSSGAPVWSIGRPVALTALQLSGLKEDNEKSLKSQAIECPSCGASLKPTLATTRSLVCGQCKAVVALAGAGASTQVGEDLAHFAQNNSGVDGAEPLIPLGRAGRLPAGPNQGMQAWQVVGYLERCTQPQGADDEQFFWREYLLYDAKAGFAFLVDSDEGWSLVRPITGAPEIKNGRAVWRGQTFTARERYLAKTTWVLGEFYWSVKQNDVVDVTDLAGMGAASHMRLSREASAGSGIKEVVWSAGSTLPSNVVAQGFGLTGDQAKLLKRDGASPLWSSEGSGGQRIIVWLVVIVVVVLILAMCSSRSDKEACNTYAQTYGEQSNEYRQCLNSHSRGSYGTSGGSFGGFSSGGGGHK